MPEDRIVLDRHDDPYRWVRRHVDHLLAHGAVGIDGVELAAFLDEVAEDMVAQVRGNLIQLLAHLCKVVIFADDWNDRHWRTECSNFRIQVIDRYRPSMRQTLDMGKVWQRALLILADAAEDRGQPLPTMPKSCPLHLDEVLDPSIGVGGLADILRTRLADGEGA